MHTDGPDEVSSQHSPPQTLGNAGNGLKQEGASGAWRAAKRRCLAPPPPTDEVPSFCTSNNSHVCIELSQKFKPVALLASTVDDETPV